jgi:hypothetical protein
LTDAIISRVKNSLKRAFIHKKTTPPWYKLDNAASIYSLMSSERSPSVFRLSCTLKENINIRDLQVALNRILIRFPYFDVNLRAGLFWPFWEKNNTTPKIFPEEKNPCQRINIYKKGTFPFKVKAYFSRIAIEFQHSLTDGTGGLTFLKALVAEYLTLRGKTVTDWGDIFRPGQEPKKEEYEYAFKNNYDTDFHEQKMREKAYRPPFELEPKGTYHVISGKLSVKELLAISRKRNVTLTELLAANYIFAHQKVLLSLPEKLQKKARKPIRLAIPVNLRNLFPSKTMRNFSYLVAPDINPKLGKYSFEEILHLVHQRKKFNINIL